VQPSVAQFEAVFKTEDGRQPAAQVFRAAQPPAAVRFGAHRHADQVFAVGAGIGLIANGCIDEAVQRDRALCERRRRGHCEQRADTHGNSDFLHKFDPLSD
jgi:hypothetical protein